MNVDDTDPVPPPPAPADGRVVAPVYGTSSGAPAAHAVAAVVVDPSVVAADDLGTVDGDEGETSGGTPLYGTPPPVDRPRGRATTGSGAQPRAGTTRAGTTRTAATATGTTAKAGGRATTKPRTGARAKGSAAGGRDGRKRSRSGAAATARVGGASLAWALGALLVCPVVHLGYAAIPLGVTAFVVGLRARQRAQGARRTVRTSLATWAMVLGLLAAVSAVPVQVAYTALDARYDDAATVGGEPVAEVPPEHPPTVEDVAFGPDPEHAGRWWYAVTVDNPNPEHRFGSALMSVEVHDAEGLLIAAEPVYVDLLPGTSVVGGTFYDLEDYSPAHVEARLPVVQRWEHVPGVGRVTVGDLAPEPREYGGVVVSGTVRSTLDESALAHVVVLAHDRAGEPVALVERYVEVPAHGEAELEATFFVDLPAGVTFTAHATP